MQTAHHRIENASAPGIRQDKQAHDGVAVQSSEAFCAADRAALNKTVRATPADPDVRASGTDL